jgi:beta-glucosidase
MIKPGKENKRKTRNILLLAAPFTVISLLLISFQFEKLSESEKADAEIERKVEELLAKMTLEEKIGQMSQVRHFTDIKDNDVADKFIGSVIHTHGPVPGPKAEDWQAKFNILQKQALSTRLGIPLLFGVDAVHGQNTFDGATIFPHNIGMGATRNSELVKLAAEATAVEARATGFNWVFSPCIAIPYNEKWGRVYEAFSESTEITSALAVASVEGHQGDLSGTRSVMATAKHYVGDGATDYGNEGGLTTVSMEELSERMLAPYRHAVEAGIGAVMVSFNSYQNFSMHAHRVLITDSLKNGMGFDGIVLTDWQGYSRFGGNKIINAGVDMVMAVDHTLDHFQKDLKEGVLNGEVSQDRVDDAVRRILRQKFRMDLFSNPFPDSSLVSEIGSEKHRSLARQAVRESLVLLKNENNTLPISRDIKKIVVVGEHANNSGLQSGGWTIGWQGYYKGWRDEVVNYNRATTILDGIKKEAKGKVVYDSIGENPQYDADIAIIVVGETPYAEMFGDIKDSNSEYQLTLTEKHQEYINKYVENGSKVVAILVSGRPMVTSKQISQSDAFIAAWLPGSEGDGVSEVLFGEYNFKGKLPHSWPASVSDFNGKYGPNFWDDSIQPLYEFGYGLKY